MSKTIQRLTLLGLLAAAVVGAEIQVRAQAEAPAAEKKATKRAVVPFHGKLKAVDGAANSISVGEMVIGITSDTKIFKSGLPATLADGTVGEEVGGSYRKTEDGKLEAVMVRFGPKPDKKKAAEAN